MVSEVSVDWNARVNAQQLSEDRRKLITVSDFPQNQLVGPCSEVLKIHKELRKLIQDQ